MNRVKALFLFIRYAALATLMLVIPASGLEVGSNCILEQTLSSSSSTYPSSLYQKRRAGHGFFS